MHVFLVWLIPVPSIKETYLISDSIHAISERMLQSAKSSSGSITCHLEKCILIKSPKVKVVFQLFCADI